MDRGDVPDDGPVDHLPDDAQPDGVREGRTVRSVVESAVAVAVLAAAYFATEVSTDYPLFGIVGVLVAAIVTLSVAGYREAVRRGVDGAIQLVARIIETRTGRRIAAAVVALVVVVAAFWIYGLAGLPGPAADGCPHPTELRILTSPDSLEPTRELASAYERYTADNNDGCPTVFPFVYAASVSTTIAALAHGWRVDDILNPAVTLGPRPDIWLPDSTVDVRRIRDLAVAENLPTLPGGDRRPVTIRSVSSIASSPIVLVVLDPSSAWKTPAGAWPAMMSNYLQESQSLAAPDPEVSTAGLMAAAGYLPAAGSRPADLALARQRVRTVLRSGATAGDDGVTLLCRYRSQRAPAGAPAPAVLTSQQLWQRFAAGSALGGGCASPTAVRPGGAAFSALSNPPVLDHPFVDFMWTAPNQRQSVEAFHAWLSAPAGRDVLKDIGLDAPQPSCSLLDDNPCVPAGLDQTLELYRSAKVPARVLLALDSSGSMGATVAAGVSRFAIATQGVIQALGQMGPNDQSGLWVFPDAAGAGPQVLVDIGTGTAQHRDAVSTSLKAVQPTGATPLYRTMIDGLKEVAATGADLQVRALVVLTDGEDTGTDLTAESTAGQVRDLAATGQVRLYVIATGDAVCGADGEGLHALTDAGQGLCFDTGPEGVAQIMADLFRALWSG